MLAIVLKILSIIGIILLTLLCLVLLALILILFVPVSYRADGRKNIQELTGRARISWLFGFVRVIAEYKEDFIVKVKVMIFTVYQMGGAEAPAKRQEKKQDKNKENHKENKQDNKKSRDSEQGILKEEVASGVEQDNVTDSKDAVSNNSTQTEKIKYTINSTCDKIKHISENVSYYKSVLEDKDTRLLFDHISVRLGKILKALKPRKLRAELLFGTGSPDTTGYAFGVYGILSPYLGSNVIVTPDFTQSVLEGEFEVAGWITIFTILLQALKLFFNKRLRIFIGKMKREDNK